TFSISLSCKKLPWALIGFSSSPGLIRVIGIIPGLTGIVFFVASIWMLIAMVIAVRQALDYKGTFRAVAVCLIGWFVQILFLVTLLSILGAPVQLTPKAEKAAAEKAAVEEAVEEEAAEEEAGLLPGDYL
ncbi:hypothetical protein ACFL2Y_01130, partial [Candidatus Omnitrophota bacterium]